MKSKNILLNIVKKYKSSKLFFSIACISEYYPLCINTTLVENCLLEAQQIQLSQKVLEYVANSNKST